MVLPLVHIRMYIVQLVHNPKYDSSLYDDFCSVVYIATHLLYKAPHPSFFIILDTAKSNSGILLHYKWVLFH